MRKYESGTGWCVWRWTDVCWKGELYLRRLHIFKTPWFAVMLHWILTPDPHPDPHDHPVSFLSITVRGQYEEGLFAGYGSCGLTAYHLNTNRIRLRCAVDIHRILEVAPGTVTLVFSGPSERIWGFHTPDGWVDWRTYRRNNT